MRRLFFPLCSIDQPLVVLSRFGRYAEIFPELGVREQLDRAFGRPRLCENLGIGDRQLGLERSIAGASVTLEDPHLIGMWKATDAIPPVF